SSANIIFIHFFAAGADFGPLKVSWGSGLSEQKQTQLENHVDFSASWRSEDDRQHAVNRYQACDGMQRSSIIPNGCALPFLAPLFFSFHRETASARSRVALRFLGM